MFVLTKFILNASTLSKAISVGSSTLGVNNSDFSEILSYVVCIILILFFAVYLPTKTYKWTSKVNKILAYIASFIIFVICIYTLYIILTKFGIISN